MSINRIYLSIYLSSITKATYDGSKCHVLHDGRLSDDFEIRSGVRQGCILSPILFLLVISDVLRSALSGMDDVCLLSHRIMDLHQMTTSVEREAEVVGLKINSGKTKMISLGNLLSSKYFLATGGKSGELSIPWKYRLHRRRNRTRRHLPHRQSKSGVRYAVKNLEE